MKQDTISTLGRAPQRSSCCARPECLAEGPKFGGKADLGGRLALLGSNGCCVFAHSIHEVECAREVQAAWRALFFLIQKEPATEPLDETFSPFFNADIRTSLFSADVLKKCAFLA